MFHMQTSRDRADGSGVETIAVQISRDELVKLREIRDRRGPATDEGILHALRSGGESAGRAAIDRAMGRR